MKKLLNRNGAGKRNKPATVAAGLVWALLSCSAYAQKSAPLVLEPGKFSYSFGLSAGWTYSFDEARARGLRLLYYPEGCLLREATSVIYIGEICHSKCSGKLDAAIQEAIDGTRELSPDMRVASAPSLKLKAGGEAQVRILTHPLESGQSRDTLAFIAHDETIVLAVLTAKDTDTWERNYQAFKEIVQGHRYYNCGRPGLSKPCK
ncbi:MAG: hypothetical protein HY942_06900 [Gammaproteobacteria bacterium]|nr:hypothetical protein [Gammaproteobacteria bacterium]